MVEYFVREKNNSSIKKINAFQPGSWINVTNPSKEEITTLSEDLGLNEGLLIDSTDSFEVPRFEKEGSDSYTFVRVPYSSNESIETTPLLIVNSKDFLMTVSSLGEDFFESIIESKVKFSTKNQGDLYLAIFNEIEKRFFGFIQLISRMARVSRHKIGKEEISNKTISKFVAYEEDLNDFLSSLVSTGAIINRLKSEKFGFFGLEHKEAVEDLSLSNDQLIEYSKSSLKNIVNVRNAYNTIMTNNLNRVIKVLATFTILLNVPTVVFSLYGMNVSLPGSENPNIFGYLFLGVLVSNLIILIVFWKNKWL